MDLLHPNLLTNEQIVNILKERQLNIPNISEMEREQLVKLYKSFILPQPCRRMRNRESIEKNNCSIDQECSENTTGKLKRKHTRIMFPEESSQPKVTPYKVKGLESTSELTSITLTSSKRKCSPEGSPSHSSHSSKKKPITWP